MSFRAAALVAAIAGECAVAGAEALCPRAANPEMLSSATSTARACFDLCPEICDTLDGLITEYMASFDPAKLKQMICESPMPFKCIFAEEPEDHLNVCRPVLLAAKGLGLESGMPMNEGEFERMCADLGYEPGNGNGNGGGQDAHPDDNETETSRPFSPGRHQDISAPLLSAASARHVGFGAAAGILAVVLAS